MKQTSEKIIKYLSIISNHNLTEEEYNFLLHEVELLVERNAYKIESKMLKAKLLSCMELNEVYTATELRNMIDLTEEISVQRVAALLVQLKYEKKVVKEMYYYYLPQSNAKIIKKLLKSSR